MATQLKKSDDSLDDLWSMIEAGALDDDGAAAREHLSAGFPIYFSEADTPEGMIIKEYPDGHREYVRFDASGEHIVSEIR